MIVNNKLQIIDHKSNCHISDYYQENDDQITKYYDLMNMTMIYEYYGMNGIRDTYNNRITDHLDTIVYYKDDMLLIYSSHYKCQKFTKTRMINS